MQKTQAYHESAIEYNEGLADAAENLAPTLKDEEVRKWCTSVAKQHRFHAGRHQKSLDKLLRRETPVEDVEQIPDGLDVPEPEEEAAVETNDPAAEELLMDIFTGGEIEQKEQPKESAEDLELEPDLGDGCVKYHNPAGNPNCEFNPNKEVANA